MSEVNMFVVDMSRVTREVSNEMVGGRGWNMAMLILNMEIF